MPIMGNVYTRNKTQDKVNGLLEDHEKLAMLTNAVVTQSYNLKEDSSWQEFCKRYRHWQIGGSQWGIALVSKQLKKKLFSQ